VVGAIIEVRQQFRGARLDDRDVDRVAGERADVVHGGKAGERDEGDFGAVRPSEEVGAKEAGDLAFAPKRSLTADVLTYCDLASDPDGAQITPSARRAEVRDRHGAESEVARGIDAAEASLIALVARTEQRIAERTAGDAIR